MPSGGRFKSLYLNTELNKNGLNFAKLFFFFFFVKYRCLLRNGILFHSYGCLEEFSCTFSNVRHRIAAMASRMLAFKCFWFVGMTLFFNDVPQKLDQRC